MESPRVTDAATVAALTEDATAYGFFQAVRLVQRLFPERQPVGRFNEPAEEVLRFGANPALAFPPSEIHVLEVYSEPPEMTVNFLGLVGPMGVLPHPYSLQVIDRLRSRDRTLKAFLDLFHHRLVSLFYRAWEKHQFVVRYERDHRDPVSEHALDLVGLGLPGLRRDLALPDDCFVFFAGLLAAQPRSAVALESLLTGAFSVPARVEQFVGGWYQLAGDAQCRLSDDELEATRLGRGVAGDAVWDQQARVLIRLGPLTRAQYDAFLPTGSAHPALRSLIRFFCHDQFDVDVQLVLARDDVPGCVLGDDEAGPPALGWCTWVRTAPFGRDADDTILTL